MKEDVGTGIVVSVSGLGLAGPRAGDYILTQPTITGAISPAAVTVTGIMANNKVYDGTTAAVLNAASLQTGIGVLTTGDIIVDHADTLFGAVLRGLSLCRSIRHVYRPFSIVPWSESC